MRRILLCALFIVQTKCGVKGNPIPPGTPAELGRGRPTYQKATREIPVPASEDFYEEVDPAEEGEEEKRQ